MAPRQSGIMPAAATVSPFARLTELLAGVEPGLSAIDMTIGEPRHPMPAFLAETLRAAAAGYGRYPPIRGTDELRGAIAGWLGRRYPALAGAIDAERHILPLSGSREGLFSAIFPALDGKRQIECPTVLIPNPFYHTYAAAAGAAMCEPVFLPADSESGFLPDLARLPATELGRTVVLYLCSPANPQGAVADRSYLAQAIDLARRHDFMLFSDECYAEIYTAQPPPGALEVSLETHGDFRNVVAFQSLSKRSNLPGLRSGFAAGDPAFMARLATFRNVAGPQMPLPVQRASARLWDEESHVEANRALYRAKFEAAARILGTRFGHRTPAGGFFLWLDMSAQGGGLEATKTLWKQSGVKVVPGSYLARDDEWGGNPGNPFIRIALVDDLATTEEALGRLVAELG